MRYRVVRKWFTNNIMGKQVDVFTSDSDGNTSSDVVFEANAQVAFLKALKWLDPKDVYGIDATPFTITYREIIG